VVQAEQNYILGSSLAFWTFLVDTISNGAGNVIGYQSLVPLSSTGSQMINQVNQVETRGGEHEISIAFANNHDDKFYLGGSVNFPIYNFEKDQVYREEDASTDNNNDFAYFEYTQKMKTTGFGVNAKLGLIFKPVEKLRLGLAFHSPTISGMTDTYFASLVANTEKYTIYPQPLSKTSQELINENQSNGSTNPDIGVYEYNLTTPYRFIGSASYVINEVRDVKRQKGFITADVEYVNYRGVRYSEIDEGDKAYYDGLNDVIKERYKGALNVKVGGELKFEKVMARAGFATYGSPYASETGLKTKRTMLSGGLGYRHHGIFVDLTYVHAFIGDVNIPYFLEDKPNPIADGDNSRGTVMLTVGFKL
jgi:long-subunit fatty acid transport protein